jgi:ABC-type nitrate/sulfonate/bicarbonate transport system substrate-binding protein
MKRHPLRSTAQIASCFVVAIIWLYFGADPVRAEAPDANPVVIRYLNDRGAVRSFEIADALGLLKQKGIRIESKGDSHGAPESLAALASGAADLAGIATPAVINAIADGAKILCIMPALGINKDVNSKFFVLDTSPIKAAGDLKDRSIAVNTPGAHLDYAIREYLRMHGLNKDGVKLVTVPGPQLDQTLRDRQADVVAVGAWQGPIASKIAAEGGVRVLFTDHDVLGDIVLGNIVMNRAFIDRHPEAVKEFVTASADAADWAEEHPDEAKTLFSQILKKRGDDPAAAAYWLGYGLPRHALYKDHDIKFWLDVLAREGALKPGQFSPEDIATNKYNANAQLVQH